MIYSSSDMDDSNRNDRSQPLAGSKIGMQTYNIFTSYSVS